MSLHFLPDGIARPGTTEFIQVRVTLILVLNAPDSVSFLITSNFSWTSRPDKVQV